jgi:hypothetical protein
MDKSNSDTREKEKFFLYISINWDFFKNRSLGESVEKWIDPGQNGAV